MPDLEIKAVKFKTVTKVPWRLRLKMWWHRRTASKELLELERQFAVAFDRAMFGYTILGPSESDTSLDFIRTSPSYKELHRDYFDGLLLPGTDLRLDQIQGESYSKFPPEWPWEMKTEEIGQPTEEYASEDYLPLGWTEAQAKAWRQEGK